MTSAHTPNTAQRRQLQAALDRHFNLDELKSLCFALTIDPEQFGAKKPEFIRDLLLYGERLEITAQIIAQARAVRPGLGIGPSGGVFNAPRLEKQVFGRATEIDALVTRLTGPASEVSAHNALSAEGSGGVGKTTLALALAHDPRIRAHFAEGVLWTSLGIQNDLNSALGNYAAALGLDVSALIDDETRADAIAQTIGSRRMLLIVDDAWQAEAALTLRRCAGSQCACLLTTRDGGLAKQFAPAPSAVRKVAPLAQTDAFALLAALAPEVCAAHPTEARALAEQVGGLPLALELLGGYLAIPENNEFAELRAESLAYLRDPHACLQLASQRLGERKAYNLQAVIELSLHDLSDEVQQVWAALSAFAHKPASFSLAAAKVVGQCEAKVIATLLRRNLLERVGAGDSEDLALHQTLRDAARARLEGMGQVNAARQRHYQFYLDLAEQDRKDWRTIGTAYEQLLHAFTHAPDDEVLALIEVLLIFQTLQGKGSDQIVWIERGLKVCQARNEREDEGTLLNNIGLVYDDLGQWERALEYYERALPVREEVGDRAGLGTTLNNIGAVYYALGQRERALEYYERALPIREEVGDRAGLGTTLNNIGADYNALGQRERALEYYERALPICEEVGDRAGLARTLNNMGAVYDVLGQRERALEYCERALTICEEVGDRAGLGATLNNIGGVYHDLGQRTRALEYYERALPIREEVGDRVGLGTTLNNIGGVYDALGQQARALPIWEEVGDRTGESVTRFNLAMVLEVEGRLAEAVAQLEQVVAIDEAIGHPDLDSDREVLARVRGKLVGVAGGRT